MCVQIHGHVLRDPLSCSPVPILRIRDDCRQRTDCVTQQESYLGPLKAKKWVKGSAWCGCQLQWKRCNII